MPVTSAYRPDPRFAALGPAFADPVQPAQFPEHTLRWRNQAWAGRVGLDQLTNAEWADGFAGFSPLPENMPQPLAMRYHGHQFRVYNPDIGDGRGFLFAQLRDESGRLLDLATKGSGQTPYSRFGDGRLTLKGGVREVLAAEMLEALGVKTSKAFSLFETGEALHRNDEPSPTRASVLTRLSHSHIRFGTFQRLAFHERGDLIRTLIDHAIACYYPHLADAPTEEQPAALLREIVAATGRLAASWMAAGFVHGVLNTDNMTITGESFDYGPWRFLPASDPAFTAAYFDESGLYAFGRQPEAASWNLAQLAGTFALVNETATLESALQIYPGAYRRALHTHVFARLGLAEGGLEEDLQLLQDLFQWMTASGAPWAQFFHDWFGGEASAPRAKESPAALLYESADFLRIRSEIEKRASANSALLSAPLFQTVSPPTLLIDEVEALWNDIALNDDWRTFEEKIAAIRQMGATLRS